MKKTLVAVPCLDNTYTLFDACLDNLSGNYVVCRKPGSLVYYARNQLIEMAMRQKVDYILWLDSDMVFNSDLLERLIADVDETHQVIAALCFRRKAPFHPVIYKTFRLGAKPDENDMVEYLDYPEGRLFEVEAMGFGCVLMTIEAASLLYGATTMPFQPIVGMGEDLSACVRMRQLGLKLYCDSSIKVGHLELTVVGEDTYKQYRATHREDSDGNTNN